MRDWSADLADAARRRALEEALARVLSPQVLRHLPDPLHLPPAGGGISEWVSARASESDVFLVSAGDGDDLIGLLILAATDAPESPGTLHLGYLFAASAWGKGHATELVRGLVANLKGRGPLRVVGGVAKGNTASARVLEKAGFRRSPDLSGPDTDMFAIRID